MARKATAKKADIDPVWTYAADRIVCFRKGGPPMDVNGKTVLCFGGDCFRGDFVTYDNEIARTRRDQAVRKVAQTLRRLLGKKLTPVKPGAGKKGGRNGR